MKKLAIIGGGRMACIFAKNATEMGIETHCFSLESGIVDKEAFDHIHLVNILDRENVLEICKNKNVDGVVATTELTIAVAAYVADSMKLNGIPLNVAEVITDKFRNREASKDVIGLFNPRYSEVNGISDLLELNFTYPIILKPKSKGGKRGITVVKEESEIEEAFRYAVKEARGSLPLIVEEFIDGGMECSVESLSFHGINYIIQITEKVTSGAPHCVELAHHQPANISAEVRNQVEKVLDNALTAIGLLNGACHTEIKIKDNKIYLIEFNARPGGDHIAYPLTNLSTGYSYIKGAIKIAIDEFEGLDETQFKNKCAGVLFVTEQTKELESIFKDCESYSWCYKKNHVSDELQSIVHNDGFNINYFIYCDESRPEILKR